MRARLQPEPRRARGPSRSSHRTLARAPVAFASDDTMELDAAAEDALSDLLSHLFDAAAPLVLQLLPLDARARAACARKA